jgi:predicted PurR-regulated permease PerM
MLLTTNLLVALLSWIAFRWIGLENAGAWGAAAGLLHLVPYLGPCATAAATGMAAFMQFGSFAMALAAAGTSLAIATVVGTFVTTWMTGRIANLNPAVVFISLLFWGWLWGVWGNAAQHSHHCHRQGRFASRGAVASDGRAVGGLIHRGCA